jgi:predicted RNA-binding protein YlxR (DUF448 family)
METNDRLTPDIPGPDGAAPKAVAERRCILTGAHGPRAALVRLALGPDGQVAADFSEKLPGRGAWISADATLLADAIARKRLHGALARAFRTSALRVPDDLAARINAGLAQRTLGRLGLENRAGTIICGYDRIAEGLGRGRVFLLLHAADARPDGASGLDVKARAAEVPVRWLPVGRDALSQALGRDNAVHVALTHTGSAARVQADVDRWIGFAGAEIAAEITGDKEIDEDTAATGVAVGATERH